MAAQIIHFIEFRFPSVLPGFGSILEPKKVFKIKNRDDITAFKIVPNAYAFIMYDIQVATENNHLMKSDPFEISYMYFIDGHIKSIRNVLKVAPDLAEKIKAERWGRAVLCNDGEFRQFEHGDCTVPSEFKKK